MKCKEIINLLNYQLDLLNTDKSYDLIEKHLQSCPSCKMEKDKLLKYKAILKSNFSDIIVPELSKSFDEKFYLLLEKETKLSIFVALKHKLIELMDITAAKKFVPAISSIALVSLMIIKLYFYPSPVKMNSNNIIKSNGSVLIEFAVLQNKKAEQKKLVEAKTKLLLKNIL